MPYKCLFLVGVYAAHDAQKYAGQFCLFFLHHDTIRLCQCCDAYDGSELPDNPVVVPVSPDDKPIAENLKNPECFVHMPVPGTDKRTPAILMALDTDATSYKPEYERLYQQAYTRWQNVFLGNDLRTSTVSINALEDEYDLERGTTEGADSTYNMRENIPKVFERMCDLAPQYAAGLYFHLFSDSDDDAKFSENMRVSADTACHVTNEVYRILDEAMRLGYEEVIIVKNKKNKKDKRMNRTKNDAYYNEIIKAHATDILARLEELYKTV